MTKEQLEEEIKAIQKFIDLIELPVADEEDFIIRCYIETESLPKTKRMIGNIRQRNGNKYQVNDIRDLILKGAEEANDEINDLAFRIYKANKKKGGFRKVVKY